MDGDSTMNPSAWLLYKDGELYTAKLEKDDRGDFHTWKPLYTADKLREVEQQRDELLDELLKVARMAEALKRECGVNPESPQAIRNGEYMNISYVARAAIAKVKYVTGIM